MEQERTAVITRPALEISDLRVEFAVPGGIVPAVDGVSLTVAPGEALAVVGESGCGKTTLARAILGLQPFVSGSITIGGIEAGSDARSQGKRIGMVWQDPFASIQPKWTLRRILEEPFRLAGQKGDIESLVARVGLAEAHLTRYPHELSGGQRQRAAIARAIALNPALVICDEPTAALDLSIQAQILNLLKDLKAEINCAFLYITHDLQTVRYLADRVAVMYMGKLVELGRTEQVFTGPRHPYTRALLDSSPNLARLGHIPEAPPGEVPDPSQVFVACKYVGRCPFGQETCMQVPPPEDVKNGQMALCHFPLHNRGEE